jgi:hypothetical protein
MNKFTVLLLYPDYLASDFGHETYMTSVEAENPTRAITKAQEAVTEAVTAQGGYVDTVRPDDFYCLCAIAGEHNDVKP